MRLPFPERLPLLPVLGFATLLCALQQTQGTTALFSAGTFAFIVVAAVAFNVTGGLSRPSGGYIAAYAVLVAIAGITMKVIFGEAGQSNLQQPALTIEVYVGTICSMLLAAYVARRFRTKRSFLPTFASNEALGRSAVGSLVVGAAALLYGIFGSAAGGGSLFAAFRQIDAFLPLAVIFGTMYEIRRTGGRRSVNAVVVIAGLLIFSVGLYAYSKQGLFSPLVCWFVAACSQRYKVNLLQIAGVIVSFGIITYYLAPYSQYGRNYVVEGQTFDEHLKTNIALLSHLETVRKVSEQEASNLYAATDVSRYYNEPHGFADRMQMMTPDDLLINYTEQNEPFGLYTTIFSFENLIPHALWKDKPGINFGNVYAHELGMLDEEDETTGISFSPSGDAFHQAKWMGILVLLPVLLTALFFVSDSACGDPRESPFALLITIGFLHQAPEGGVPEIIRAWTFDMVGIFVAAFLAAKVIPLVADLLMGAKKDTAAMPVVMPMGNVVK